MKPMTLHEACHTRGIEYLTKRQYYRLGDMDYRSRDLELDRIAGEKHK